MKPTTHVAIVLDESGSMASITEATIQAFNAQLKALRTSEKKWRREAMSVKELRRKHNISAVNRAENRDEVDTCTRYESDSEQDKTK